MTRGVNGAYNVIRFTNTDVTQNLEHVLAEMLHACQAKK